LKSSRDDRGCWRSSVEVKTTSAGISFLASNNPHYIRIKEFSHKRPEYTNNPAEEVPSHTIMLRILPERCQLSLMPNHWYYGGTMFWRPIGTNYGCGTLFKITPRGTLTTLYNFCSQSGCADGQIPVGPLVQGTDGNLYGTTGAGGTGPCSSGCGTVFKITPSGALTTLHSFDLTDGDGPNGGLIQATDGNFYGTTSSGGTNNSNCNSGSCGTVFKMTPTGTLTTLYRFDYTDGANPEAALIQANDGNFYGTTSGTIFKITPTGTLTTLHTGVDANALIQDTNGTFYGTTLHGGRIVYHYCGGSCGTIFSLSVGLWNRSLPLATWTDSHPFRLAQARQWDCAFDTLDDLLAKERRTDLKQWNLTWESGPATIRVIIQSFKQGEQTKVVLTQEGFPDPNLVKIVAGGTNESFEKLDQFLAVRASRWNNS
jgi:uncharacterized repeat protein (TIGR03803 family)